MSKKRQILFITSSFIAARLILLISSPLEVVAGYGDYWNFFQQAEMGWPFIDYWTEFPPVFPYLSRLLYLAVGGRESAYIYSLALFISLFQAGCVWCIGNLESRIHPEQNWMIRTVIYGFLTVGLFYSWSYFDALAVFLLLLALLWILEKRDHRSSIILSLGVLVKWFPFLVIPALWKFKPIKEALKITIIVIVLVAMVWACLYLLNGEMTSASLVSQGNKGSWESIWALLDGNIRTGNFSPDVDRMLPSTASLRTGNSPVISPWITLAILGGLGAILLYRTNLNNDSKLTAFIGLTILIFFLWSPGYSPQWVLYLIPFAILLMPWNESILLSVVLILINLLEWPVLLSRGYAWSLYYLIPLRTMIMILLGTRLYQASHGKFEIR